MCTCTHKHTHPDPLISLKARTQAESLLCWTDLRTPCHRLCPECHFILLLYTGGLYAAAMNVVNSQLEGDQVRSDNHRRSGCVISEISVSLSATDKKSPNHCSVSLCLQVQRAGLHLEQRHALRLGRDRVPGDVRGGGRVLLRAPPPLHDHRVLCQEAAPPQEREQAPSQAQVCVGLCVTGRWECKNMLSVTQCGTETGCVDISQTTVIFVICILYTRHVTFNK